MIQLQFDFSSDGGQMGENSISGDRMADSSAAGSVNNSNNMRPVVALYHSHTSETYIDDPRDQDANGRVFPGNLGQVVRVGQELATILSRKYDFKVIHSTEIHDESYVRSYYNSRKTVKNLLKNEPQLEILFDLHRDGVKSQGREAYTTTFKGKNIARVMIVVTNGKFDFAHLDLEEHHLQWQQNLNFARTLAAKMEEMYPGLLKRVEIRDTTYNQDLHPQALLLEIGDYQNTTSEALRSAGMVADVIAAVTYSSQQ
ncbi:MAG: stage II sporulation protein P [Halanaerobiaceae bacterium]